VPLSPSKNILFSLLCFGFVAAFATPALGSTTALCPTHEDPCASPLVEGTTIFGLAEHEPEAGRPFLINTTSIDLLCEHSEFKGKTTSQLAAPLVIELSSLTFTNCETHSGSECDFTAVKLGTFLVLRTGLHLGWLQWHNTEFNFQCGAFIDCTYGGLMTMVFEGGAPAAVAAENLTMEETAGTFCPDTSQWQATYELASPNPLHLAS
jgi:hypothetical protein